MKWFTCIHCGKPFTEDNFYMDKSKPTGRKPRCKVCELAYINREKRREYEKKYRLAHPERRKEILERWYEKNKEKHKEVQTLYRKTEQFKANHRNHSHLRRARMNEVECEDVDLLAIYEQSPSCFYCKAPLPLDKVEFDHYIPIIKKGPHKKENIRVSCKRCNRKKGGGLYQMV